MTVPGVDLDIFVLDTMCLAHFARADRLDELGELLLDSHCWTTRVVLEELRAGLSAHPVLADALRLEWLAVAALDTLDEIRCFTRWVKRLGTTDRDLGEASVLAAAELRAGIAITDDRDATRTAREFGAAVHGTVWLLARACRAGKLPVIAAGNLIETLRATGLRLPCTGPEFSTFAGQHGLL